jgi:hypothetical protein
MTAKGRKLPHPVSKRMARKGGNQTFAAFCTQVQYVDEAGIAIGLLNDRFPALRD